MDGLLVIDKPAGITSHDVVDRLRRILGTRRVGHTGTLDPFATGVMVVLVGRATRLARFLGTDEKEYEATIKFGFETDTGDRTGNPKSDLLDAVSVSREDLESTLTRFVGDIEQVPPMYSAKKVGGKKLYESARKGVDVERNPVRVRITQLELIEGGPGPQDTCQVRVACSAGTYIRTLAEDIGRTIGVGAHLAELRRTRSGRFVLNESVKLDELAAMKDPSAMLLPMKTAVGHLVKIVLPEARVEPTRSGLSTRVDEAGLHDRQSVRMISPDGELLAIGVYSIEESSAKPKIVLV